MPKSPVPVKYITEQAGGGWKDTTSGGRRPEPRKPGDTVVNRLFDPHENKAAVGPQPEPQDRLLYLKADGLWKHWAAYDSGPAPGGKRVSGSTLLG